MSELTLSQSFSETDENYEQAIEECWTELQNLRKQIDADQSEIERLQAETSLMLKELKATVGV